MKITINRTLHYEEEYEVYYGCDYLGKVPSLKNAEKLIQRTLENPVFQGSFRELQKLNTTEK